MLMENRLYNMGYCEKFNGYTIKKCLYITGCQSGPPTAFAARWEQHMGVFRTSPGIDVPSPTPDQDRQALTAALVHFSKAIG